MKVKIFGFVITLLLGASSIVLAQDPVPKKTEIVKNPDGTYTVIEYPVGKEVIVTLTPGTTLASAKGSARVIRSADGSKVYLDLAGVPADTTSYYAYAVDPTGTPTLLGPVTIENGIAKAEFSTPLNQFMLVLSPAEGLTAVNPSTIAFHSAVPQGYSIIPRKTTGDTRAVAVQGVTMTKYDAPMLNISTFGEKERQIKIKFSGKLDGLEGKAFITHSKGATKIKMRFDDMKRVPADKRFVLWAVSPEGTYTKLGQIIHTGQRTESEIKSETSLTDFGLFVTVEETEVNQPSGTIYSVFTVPAT